jgi:HSP20 family protein
VYLLIWRTCLPAVTSGGVGQSKEEIGMATTKKKPNEEAQAVPVRGSDKPAAKSAAATPFATLRDVERLFQDFRERGWRNPFRGEWPQWPDASKLLPQTPAVDVVDREKEVVVRAQLPGFKKSDLDVSIAERTLTIKGSTREEQKEEKDNYFHQEIRTGSFSRSVLLPTDVDAGKAQATFKDGVLELTLPKRRVAKQQQVPVR